MDQVAPAAKASASISAQGRSTGNIDRDYSLDTLSNGNRATQQPSKSNLSRAGSDLEIAVADDDDPCTKDEILEAPADDGDVLAHTIHLRDNPTVPAITFRSLFLGVALSVFGGVLSGIYYYKPQSVDLPAVFFAVIAFIFGELMATVIPRKGRVGRFLNPHPFNIKEHLAITIMANAASISSQGIELITVERLYYNREIRTGLAILILLSSQYMGYGIAGLMRRTLVYPKSMLWPGNIPIIAMLENLHLRLPSGRKPLRVFTYVFVAIFIWEIFPQWICPILTGVSVFCLANQGSTTFTNLFGGTNGNEGLGLFSLCFDWQYISGGSSPLYYPISSLISQGVGICGCIVLFVSLYYTNTWDAKNYPFLSQVILSNTSQPGQFVQYNQSLIIGKHGRINGTAVHELGLPAMSASNVVNTLLVNMVISAALVHLVLWHPTETKAAVRFLHPRQIAGKISSWLTALRSQTWKDAHDAVEGHFDPHYSLMLMYRACPNWWYGAVLIASLVAGVIVVYVADTRMALWQYVVAVILGWALIIVAGSMEAITGVGLSLQTTVQMIGGYIRPRHPRANMYFTLYGYTALLQGTALAEDLKMAQYGHLAPRVTFAMQMIGTLIGSVMNYIMANSIIRNQREILLSIEGTNIWSGQQPQQFNAQSILWGGFAHQLFSVGRQYQWVTLSIFFGFVAPLPFWILHKKFPHLGLHHVNTPIVIYYLCLLNVGINSSLMMFFLVGFASQWFIRRRYPNLFVRYNYIVSAALDGGTSVMVFILSFAVLGAAGAMVNFPQYWGNNAGGNLDRCASE